MRLGSSKKYTGLLYISPWLIGVGVFVIYPFVVTLALSFTDYNLFNQSTFVGMDNFKKLFTDDPDFLKSIGATLRYAFFTVPFQLAFALFIAFILNFKLKGIGMFRAAYYMPSILGGNIAVSILWKFLFSGEGLINQVLGSIGIGHVGWLSSTMGAMFVILMLRIWQFGSAMVIFLAALKEIPEELYESAQVDGAGKIRIFFKVTVPLITPTIFFNLVMQLVNAMQEFNAPYMITGGGPLRSTYLTSMMIYDNAFRFFNMGYASAMSWILFVVIMLFAGLLFKSSSYWVYYSDGGGGK